MTTDELEHLYELWSALWDECLDLERAKSPLFDERNAEQYKAWRVYYDAYLSQRKRHQPTEQIHE